MKLLRLLVVADARRLPELRVRFATVPGMEVAGCASDTGRAVALLRALRPDAVALELDSQQSDRVACLRALVSEKIAPVVTLGPGGGDVAKLCAEVLRSSAPRSSRGRSEAPRLAPELAERVKSIAAWTLRPPRWSFPTVRAALRPCELIAIAASTGGTIALAELLQTLTPQVPAIVVVQHMLSEFTRAYAERLDRVCALDVREAEDGLLAVPGRVLIAPAGRHMRVERTRDGACCVRLGDDAPVGKYRPSADVLFHSCASVVGRAALGVVLTGMGEDGALGLLAMREAGAHTIVQDEASSAVFGMPRAAIAHGAAEEVLPLASIARVIALCAPE